MQYMALIYGDPELQPKPGTPEFDTMMKGYFAANEIYRRDGVLVAGEPLQGVETATSLRIRAGKTETMDGPFAETKERLGGFYIFDCADLDAALKYAAMIPGTNFGTVELRPLMVMH
jgi:hypothetical protein